MDLEQIYLENYIFPKLVTGGPSLVSIEDRLNSLKDILTNLYYGIKAVKFDNNISDKSLNEDPLIKPIIEAGILLNTDVTKEKPSKNFNDYNSIDKVKEVQAQFNSTLTTLFQLKNAYSKQSDENMSRRLEEVDSILDTPATSFSRNYYEPLKKKYKW